MYYLVVFVLDDVNLGPDVLDAWVAAGVGGITILESTGLARIQEKEGLRDDIPLMPSLRSLLNRREEHHRTLFSIVEGEAMVEKVIAATEEVVGKLNTPNTGIMFAFPLTHVVGVPRNA
jgi:hypothetical protein